MAVALVTGVSRTRGIAATVAQRLRDDGYIVVTAGWTPYDTDHHQGIDEQVASDLQFDLAEPDAPAQLLAAAERHSGPVTSLVLAHAFDAGQGLFESTSESIDRHMAVNVRSFLLLMRAFAERVRERGATGRIVLFSSGPPQKGAIAYGASKGAIEWMTYSAATELGPLGINVNAVNPGPNQTGWMSPEVERAAATRTPLGRAGQPADAAALVSFLLSPDGAFINGQLITSDGGHAIAAGSWPR
ncbi:MAG TPA: SDR family oxidoreductase [Solirubrobacteraceae bacterium]|nr:SDR family oxidoreductase [Solirubrobacteraceae bacterium]